MAGARRPVPRGLLLEPLLNDEYTARSRRSPPTTNPTGSRARSRVHEPVRRRGMLFLPPSAPLLGGGRGAVAVGRLGVTLRPPGGAVGRRRRVVQDSQRMTDSAAAVPSGGSARRCQPPVRAKETVDVRESGARARLEGFTAGCRWSRRARGSKVARRRVECSTGGEQCPGRCSGDARGDRRPPGVWFYIRVNGSI